MGESGVKKIVLLENMSRYHNQLSNIIDNKQDILVSGSNIKTIDGYSILGEGNIVLPQIVYIPNEVLMPDHPIEGVFYMIGEDDPHESYCTFEALENETIVTFSKNSVQFSIDGCQTWNELSPNVASPVINAGDMISFKSIGYKNGENDKGTFTVNKNFNLKGNVMSLLFGDDGYKSYDLTGYDYAFKCLFLNCTTLQSVSNDFLPATTLSDNCYDSMFQGCTSLIIAPELPATTLSDNCYDSMFKGCTALNYIKALFTTTPGSKYTTDWVNGVSSTGTFVKNAAATWNVTGVNGIPSGWTIRL